MDAQIGIKEMMIKRVDIFMYLSRTLFNDAGNSREVRSRARHTHTKPKINVIIYFIKNIYQFNIHTYHIQRQPSIKLWFLAQLIS